MPEPQFFSSFRQRVMKMIKHIKICHKSVRCVQVLLMISGSRLPDTAFSLTNTHLQASVCQKTVPVSQQRVRHPHQRNNYLQEKFTVSVLMVGTCHASQIFFRCQRFACVSGLKTDGYRTRKQDFTRIRDPTGQVCMLDVFRMLNFV